MCLHYFYSSHTAQHKAVESRSEGELPSCFHPPSHLCLHLHSESSPLTGWLISPVFSGPCLWSLNTDRSAACKILLCCSHLLSQSDLRFLLSFPISSGQFCPTIMVFYMSRIHYPLMLAFPQDVSISWL